MAGVEPDAAGAESIDEEEGALGAAELPTEDGGGVPPLSSI